MATVVVKKVQRIGGGDSAEVTLASSKGEIVAFCYPCDLSEGQVVPNILYGLVEEARAAFLSDWPESIKQSRNTELLERVGPLGYRGLGHVLDQAAGLVEVCGFVLELGRVPCTGPIEFTCSRIDISGA